MTALLYFLFILIKRPASKSDFRVNNIETREDCEKIAGFELYMKQFKDGVIGESLEQAESGTLLYAFVTD